jgi:WD40 repeat protein
MSIYSPKGIEGGILVSGSADHEIRNWHLVKKKISSKINVQRPDEEFLLKYKDSHEPVTNYAEDHILNTPKAIHKQQ